MPRYQRTAFIVHLYLHFLCSCFFRGSFFILHVVLSDTNSFFLTDLLDGTLTGTTTQDQSGRGSNVNEVVFYILQISGTGAASSNTIWSLRHGMSSTTEFGNGRIRLYSFLCSMITCLFVCLF